MTIEAHVQQSFDLRRGAQPANAVTGKGRGNDPRIVEDEHIALPQELRQVAEDTVFETIRPHDQQFR